MAGPRAVLLDLWHTIVWLEPEEEERFMGAQIDAVSRVLEGWPRSPRGRHPPLRDPRRAAEQVRAEGVEAAARGVSVPPGVQAVHAARLMGRRARPLEWTRALESLVASTRFHLCPGVLDALEELRRQHFLLGVVSNTIGEPGEAWQALLDRMGVGSLIDAWAFSDQLPWTKPAPQIFLHCLGTLSVPPDRAVHVGDGWTDIAGARAARLRAGVLYTGAQTYGETYRKLFAPSRPELEEAEYRFREWPEFPALAEQLLPT